MKQFSLVILFFGFSNFLWAQNSTNKLSDWKDYFSYHSNNQIATGGDRIYCANNNSIFYLQTSDMTYRYLNKCNKLSDVGITAIACDSTGSLLIVGYENGNIDIVKDDQVKNIVDLKSKLISSKKSINNIVLYANKAFLATSFGIVVLNIDLNQIDDTYILNSSGQFNSVNNLFIDKSTSTIYAATNNGICYATIGSSNLADYSNWVKIAETEHCNYKAICVYNGTLYFDKFDQPKDQPKDSLFSYKNGVLKVFSKNFNNLRKLRVIKEKLYIISANEVVVYDKNETLKWDYIPSGHGFWQVVDAYSDYNDEIWLLDNTNGLYNVKEDFFYYPNSPGSDNIFSISKKSNSIILTHGLPWSYSESKLSYFSFDNNRWDILIDKESKDPLRLALAPIEDLHYFVGTYFNGISEYDNQNVVVNHYNSFNSSLGSNLISDVVFDSTGNLFVYTSKSTAFPFSVYTKEKKWYSWTYSSFSTNLGQQRMIIDKHNNKWVGTDNGILVFNEKNTFSNTADDNSLLIPLIDNSEETFGFAVNTLALDLDNVLWVGTNSGIGYYSNTDNVFSNSKPRFSRNKITINGVVDYLLANESITAIEVDAANRKWIGTGNGLFLVSSNGTEVLEHFTVDNSPLPSNAISSLKIFADRSTLFIGTTKGLLSYNIGIKEAKANFSDIAIYPNPVKHDFNGLVRFEGLMAKSVMKIMDIDGNLVYESTSEGGTAFWNGNNLIGERVASGVYIVVLVSSDQTQKKVSKIIFIN